MMPIKKNVALPVKTPNPGSDEAIKLGCLCPVLDNDYGRGVGWGDGPFWINNTCPIHGEKNR